ASRNVKSQSPTSHRRKYQVTFSTNGNHYLFALGEGDSGSGSKLHDTCNIGLDGTLPATGTGVGGKFELLGGFFWNGNLGATGPAASLEVSSPGEHIVDLWMQKDGLVIDQIALSTDPGYSPPSQAPDNESQI